MERQLLVLVVEPDQEVADALAAAISAAGHRPVVVSAATWATALLSRHAPDVVLLERSAPGYERLLDAVDDLDFHVPVLVTQLRDLPASCPLDEQLLAAIVVHWIENAASSPWGRIAALMSRARPPARPGDDTADERSPGDPLSNQNWWMR